MYSTITSYMFCCLFHELLGLCQILGQKGYGDKGHFKSMSDISPEENSELQSGDHKGPEEETATVVIQTKCCF